MWVVVGCMGSTTHNGLTQSEIDQLAEMFDDYEAEFREAHEVKHEDDELIVFSDTTGHELNDIAEAEGIDRDRLSHHMHEQARRFYDRDRTGGDAWSVADPVVFRKQTSDENEVSA